MELELFRSVGTKQIRLNPTPRIEPKLIGVLAHDNFEDGNWPRERPSLVQHHFPDRRNRNNPVPAH